MSRTNGIAVRLASPDDAPLLLPMFEAFYGRYLDVHDPEGIRGRLVAASSADIVLLALVNGHPAGFASLRIVPQIETPHPHAELSDIYVNAGDRRRGVGRALMVHAERLARERGCPRMQLTTGIDNDGARAFYRALGYAEFGFTLHRELEGTR